MFDIYFQLNKADTELSVGKSGCLSGDVTGVISGAMCELMSQVRVSNLVWSVYVIIWQVIKNIIICVH